MNGSGQKGILEYYQHNNNEYSTTREISKAMNMSNGSVNNSLNRLLKFGRVEYKDAPNEHRETIPYKRIIRKWRLKK